MQFADFLPLELGDWIRVSRFEAKLELIDVEHVASLAAKDLPHNEVPTAV
jgi:hypothetical protein